ncbi:zinc finger protein 217 isoform X2 [Nothobranchius furzeri]|uniref:Transcript variant X4 n=2 Tax=Nothobranchius furzeri TaxID=105023 RepID=A0A1A8AWQ4_NOTFU|nr:zinc finger protein 217 isoform X2 [Nothobranchius furzeri]KAF7209224.1 transcript variant X4 [Nothobranchius furzeri]
MKMPIHSLLPFVDSPDGIAQGILSSNDANVPGSGFSMMPHTYVEKVVFQSGQSDPLSCMFCDQTFTHQDELGPHVLTQHPATFSEPTVLRVEAEFRIPGERPQPKLGGVLVGGEEAHSCIVCGQVAQDAGELETHMRKHKDYFTYCCNVCGRRFRETWFLKNHMKMHIKPGPKSRALQDLEAPFTINGVAQESAPEPVVAVYKMCMVCGFFFPDHGSLAEHSKVHNREMETEKDEAVDQKDGATESCVDKETFLCNLNLQPASTGNALGNMRSSKWIPQLDPFNTYQAWQLATKGKIAVGLNSTKDVGQEMSTDNEDCPSDKEELGLMWTEDQEDKAGKEVCVRELQSQQQVENPHPPRRSLMQKRKAKDRPTTCEQCRRTFRTYHQLVLHSRVHKRDRGSGESPASSVDAKMPRVDSLDPAEEAHEETTDENFISGEDGFDRSKVRSKACSCCGKSFRSSYYLTVHMRTHTGEKPFKCAYCDYAAAQKTSLKYHLERRHKDKPYAGGCSRPGPSLPSPGDSPAPNRSKLWASEERLCMNKSPEDPHNSSGTQFSETLVQVNAEDNEVLPVSANLKQENEQDSDVPLNLSLKGSLSHPTNAETRNALNLVSCALCAFKTLYPEVLIMHKKLTHEHKSEGTKNNGLGGNAKQKRYTGCPPVLNGNDVTPLLMLDRRHPRRTKSPPPRPTKPQENKSGNPSNGPKLSPIHAPLQDGVQEHFRQTSDSHPSQEVSRHTELMRTTTAGGKFVMDRTCPLGIIERSYPGRSGSGWHSDAARLCLSSQFGSFPQMRFGEPSGKRPKFSTSRLAETGEKSGFRGSPGDGPKTLPVTGRSVQPTSQGLGSSTASEALCQIKSPSTVQRDLESEWSMMNLLHSCTQSDLASFYHSTPTNPSHRGLANPRAGRTLLYQHLPALPNLQRGPSGSFSNQRYGTADKTS